MQENNNSALIPLHNSLARTTTSLRLTNKILAEYRAKTIDPLAFWEALDTKWKCILYGHWKYKINRLNIDAFNKESELTKKIRLLTDEDVRILPKEEIKEIMEITDIYVKDEHITDLSPLAALTNLEMLNLYGNKITDLRPLAALTNLKNLGLIKNQITDLSPLAALTNLERLSLGLNQITDLSPLAALTNLKTLDLVKNQITEEQKNWLRKALPNITCLYI